MTATGVPAQLGFPCGVRCTHSPLTQQLRVIYWFVAEISVCVLLHAPPPVQVGALVGSEKVFHGLSSKPAAQLPKQEKALAQAVINCAVVSISATTASTSW